MRLLSRLLRPFRGFLQVITRLLSFIGRELVETVRRPGALVSLVFGPFLVMAIFGLGYSGVRQPLVTALVIPPESGLPSDVETYAAAGGPGINITIVAPTDEGLDARLRAGELDVVAIAPMDAEARFQAGEQSVIEVRIDRTDPVQSAYAGFMANEFSSGINRELIRRAAVAAQDEAIRLGRPDAGQIPPEVIASPTRAEVLNKAPIVPSIIGFFGPAVLALILQHMAVTLIALSVVRDRTSGVIELFRISPVNAWEIVAGKVLGFGVLCAAISVATLALLSVGLGVPMLGDPLLLGGIVGLLILASLGLGLLISIVSDSERQAVQLSLLVLLASVFFSGFVLPIQEFETPVRVMAYGLPVTTGIRLTQDVMLRGVVRDPLEIAVLAGIAVVLLVACWVLLRRSMARA
jgi:ABC-2 type transport system permease protein